MPNQINLRTLVKWLDDHHFVEQKVRGTGHRKFKLEGKGAITVPGHGPTDLTKKHVGMLIRSLAGMGFDPDTTRTELETRKWGRPDQ